MKKSIKSFIVTVLIIIMVISLSGCGEKKTKSISNKEETKFETGEKLEKIYSDFILKLWNDLFCNVNWYTYNGKGAGGKKFDLDKALKNADETMEKMDEYDNFINGLDDEYNDIKEVWNVLLPEAERLYNQIKSDKPQAKDDSYELDLNKYNTYMYDYYDLVEEKKGIDSGKLTNDADNNLTIIWNNFIIEMWNELFCNVNHYLEDGLDATGNEFNIERAIKKADKAIKRKDEYDNYINSLDSEYDEIKEVWNKLVPETERLYNMIKMDIPKAKDSNYKFDTKEYEEYMYEYQSLM